MIISFPRELTLAAIDGVAQYHETMESQLQSAKSAEKLKIREKIEAMGLGMEEQMEEWDLATQSYDMMFNMLLPNFFRYSLLILLFLVVENKLGELSHVAKSAQPNLPMPPHPKRSIVNSYEQYFTNMAGISSLDWGKVHELSRVRNCIVHASGKVKGRPDEPLLREIAAREVGLSISGARDVSQSNLYPLYLEDDMLVIKAEYCAQVIKQIRHFFERLCDALGLPKITVEKES